VFGSRASTASDRMFRLVSPKLTSELVNLNLGSIPEDQFRANQNQMHAYLGFVHWSAARPVAVLVVGASATAHAGPRTYAVPTDHLACGPYNARGRRITRRAPRGWRTGS